MITRLLPILILVGCATSQPKKGYDIGDIKNDDFKKIEKVSYSSADDRFKQVESDLTDALNEESIQRVFTYGGSVEVKGVLGEIGKLCYENKFKEAFILVKINNKAYNDNPIFWTQVGTCYLLEGNSRKALLFYNRALGIKGDYAPALNNLGVMYMRENDFSRALVAFERARKNTAFGRTPRFNLANLYLSFGLYQQAESHLLTLGQVSKKDVDVLNMLGTSYLMQGKADLAIKNFENIDSDFLENPKFGINYALALYMGGRPDRARDVLDDVKQKDLRQWKDYYKSVSKFIGGKK